MASARVKSSKRADRWAGKAPKSGPGSKPGYKFIAQHQECGQIVTISPGQAIAVDSNGHRMELRW